MATKLRRASIAAFAIALPLTLTACSSGDSSSDSSGDTGMTTTAESTEDSTASESQSGSDSSMSEPFGPGCAAVPADGPGSFQGMATDPVATAASNNPVLSTLVSAVQTAGLAETLNTTQDITVFAPTNDAFAAVPADALAAAMADPSGQLTTILTNHVVQGKIAPEDLAGDHQTLAGTTITVTGSGEDFMVGNAKVVCGNVQTANATVYIIDQVLLPA